LRVLVVGSGAREHALVEKLSRSPHQPEMYAAPGNPGISRIARTVNISQDNIPALRDFAIEEEIDLTVVGPEEPLIWGIADAFWEEGLKLFGPSSLAARIEGSKIFAKEVMRQAGVPTADFRVFEEESGAVRYLRTLSEEGFPVVIKAEGPASGKGVKVADSREDAEDFVYTVFGGRFGSAGNRILIEEYLVGQEVSILALTDGENILPLLPAQDYKAIYDGGQGPNTGGMGAYSPIMWMQKETYRSILEDLVEPTVRQLSLIGSAYTGLLYAGVTVTAEGPKVLEFNCRFGDPETQALLPRMGSDMLGLMFACVDWDIGEREISWSTEKAVCVVLASEGYPDSSSTGDEITGLDNAPEGVYVYHAATEEREGRFYTDGGRVLNVVGVGADVLEARARTYAAVDQIDFPGIQYRTDIAVEALDLEDLQ
jgi:phosphoribosylamine--glycine ligase